MASFEVLICFDPLLPSALDADWNFPQVETGRRRPATVSSSTKRAPEPERKRVKGKTKVETLDVRARVCVFVAYGGEWRRAGSSEQKIQSVSKTPKRILKERPKFLFSASSTRPEARARDKVRPQRSQVLAHNLHSGLHRVADRAGDWLPKSPVRMRVQPEKK